MVTMMSSIVRDPEIPLIVNEDCPRRRINFLLNTKWTSMVIYVLSFGPLRTGQLQRSMPGISKKMLIQTLRELERDKMIERKVFQVVPPVVQYSLSSFGAQFVEPLMLIYEWADKNSDLLDQLQLNRMAPIEPDANDPVV